jgi:soluble lytic murein transglycosylase-like protein
MTISQRVAGVVMLLIALVATVHQVRAADPVARWRPLIEQVAARYDVPADLVEAVVAIESNGNPRAVGAAGERGLMQLLPDTARRLGVVDAFDPAANLDGGTRYLAAELRACAGDEACALHGYNGGPRARTNPLPSTRAYVAAVLARRGRAVAAPAAPVLVLAARQPPRGLRSLFVARSREE